MRFPKHRALLAVCVALLLVTAGCSGGTNPTSTTLENTDTPTTATTTNPTTTTSSTTTTGTWSPNASVEQYPPGVAENGSLTNASRLVDAHFNATANKPVELTYQGVLEEKRFVKTYTRGTSEMPHYSTSNETDLTDTIVPAGYVAASYHTDSHSYVKKGGNETEDSVYVRQNNRLAPDRWLLNASNTTRRTLSFHFSSGNYTVNGTVERDGQTFIQLTANTSTPPNELQRYEGTVLVTPAGVIYNLDASYTPDRAETDYNESISLDTDVNWSEAPAWVGDVPQLSMSVTEDGSALEIRNTGGETLPANVSFDVYTRDTNESVVYFDGSTADAVGNVTTGEQLEPGDVIYVTGNTDGNTTSFTLHDERTGGEYTFVAAKVSGEYEDINYSLITGVVET